ncbi:hypothetical protein AB0N06_08925 [Streptomyces sp. NPDC051020]|uniref:hypothetical protein n=1 Tax=Streptomyces sp. NPDC051020 TaxID=3155409 RepID=UPI0034222F17
MPLLLFLNEKSCESNSGPAEVAAGMREFVCVLKRLREWRSISLATQSPLPEAELARGYYYGQWCSDNRNKDQHRFIQAMRNRRTTFSDALHSAAAPDQGGVEHRHNGVVVQGLGAAHLADGMAISLPLDPIWNASQMELEVEEVTEDPVGGELLVEEFTASVRHASATRHLDTHEQWGRSEGIDAVSSPVELWELREDIFPNVQLLPRVQGDLEKLDPKWFKPARRMLKQLEASAAGWDPASATGPDWEAPHITPEHEHARKQRYWDDLDGVSRCFELHGRLNRGAGRIYFRLVPEEKAIRVAYIGPHL